MPSHASTRPRCCATPSLLQPPRSSCWPAPHSGSAVRRRWPRSHAIATRRRRRSLQRSLPPAPGQTICLASGSYGTWQGTNKPITIRAADGATPDDALRLRQRRRRLHARRHDAAWAARSRAGAHDITIRNTTSTRTRPSTASRTRTSCSTTTRTTTSTAHQGRRTPAWASTGARRTPSGVTIQNSRMRGGDSDGVHTGVAVNVLNNTFTTSATSGAATTPTTSSSRAPTAAASPATAFTPTRATTQGITSYDGGTNGVTIEDNVVDITPPLGHRVLRRQELDHPPQHRPLVRRRQLRLQRHPCGYIALTARPRTRRQRHPGLRQRRHHHRSTTAPPPPATTTTRTARPSPTPARYQLPRLQAGHRLDGQDRRL